jgi:excisionase family DNA binding protein
MSTTVLRGPQRDALEQSLVLLQDVADQRAQEAVERIKTALREADQDEYLTTAEAARALGIRSVNTVKAWISTGYLTGKKTGGRTLIPRSEIERLETDARVQAMRAMDRLHDASGDLGNDEGLTAEELRVLEETRPGMLPWKR